MSRPILVDSLRTVYQLLLAPLQVSEGNVLPIFIFLVVWWEKNSKRYGWIFTKFGEFVEIIDG